MLDIIDNDYIVANALVAGVAELPPETLTKYRARAKSIVETTVDISSPRFTDNSGMYTLPDDLKLATLYIVEHLYASSGAMIDRFASERAGDYAYSRQEPSGELDLPRNIAAILRKYAKRSGAIPVTLSTTTSRSCRV